MTPQSFFTDEEPTAHPSLAGHMLNAIVPGLRAHGFEIDNVPVDAHGLTVLAGRRRIRISWEELDPRPATIDGHPHLSLCDLEDE